MKGKLAFLNDWYERTKALARHKHAEPALAGVSFIESSVFPIPPDIMLIPMVQADHSRAWRYAFVCTIASVLGGIFGYILGLFFFDMLAAPVLESLGKTEKMDSFANKVENWGAMAVFGAGLTPFPYKVITIMSGALKLNFGIFIIASVLARSLRFFLVAGVVKSFGDQAEYWLKEHFAKFTIAVFIFILIAYLIYKQITGH